ncbi:ribosomal protein S6 kinase-related protein-like [Babylonia areolata]|uniref:ribosomal protein S6 kinase-related protein-like n=1 Tax=Babylonia areolata TaxID=304850 RepID=UPI003FD4182C
MGNNQNKLRKAQSVPDTQNLPPDASFVREKSRSSQRLSDAKHRDGKHGRGGGGDHKIPVTEALFLPHFPLRGEIEDLDFEVVEVIAQGAFGNVLKVQREDDKKFYAMKVLDKQQIIQENAVKQCKDEATIQQMAGEHPFIVKTYEYWQSRRSLYIVLDYVPYGEMFTLWTFHGAFPESLAKIYIAEMAMILDYLHNNGVIYRDVKMENILLDGSGHIQLTDFGLAKWLQGGSQTRTVCGTLQYMAPEVLTVYPYDHAADWWSLGILMYTMLLGKYPVDAVDNHTNMATRVFECDYLLPGHFGEDVQDVIHRLLTKSPQRRLSSLYTLEDLPFFRDLNFTDLIERKVCPTEMVAEDFFPMSGTSWAPHLVESREKDEFDGFDSTNCRWNLPPDTVPVFV